VKADTLIKYAVIAGIIGIVIAILGLIASGSADHAEAYHIYLVSSAIVFGSALIASALKDRK
jgi:ABC-type Mn2+/Zn2+ transport system permease subunit